MQAYDLGEGADLLVGDCRAAMAALDECSVDAIVTDPPYGLEFMGKDWDAPWKTDGFRRAANTQDTNRNNMFGRLSRRGPEYKAGEGFQLWCEEWAREALRVLKPGGHLLAFGGTRTFHRLTCAIEDAGFEVRDCLMWLYGTGFPKSLNLGDGRGSALKPGWEPIVLARRPLDGTLKANVEKWGTGALNVDACRLPRAVDDRTEYGRNKPLVRPKMNHVFGHYAENSIYEGKDGRWPLNVSIDKEIADELGERHRWYYCAKASREERDLGLDHLPQRTGGEATEREDGSAGTKSPRAGAGRTGGARNFHPTVKPLELMRWLVRLVAPPFSDAVVLDPFVGSGSTMMAALLEGRSTIGCELSEEYVDLIAGRVAWAQAQREAA